MQKFIFIFFKNVVFGIFYLSVLCLLMFLVIEVLFATKVVRPAFSMHGLEIVIDKELLYRVKPNSAPDINRFGYRTHEYSIQKKHKRVVFLGDSFVMGTDINSDQSIPAQLQKTLGEKVEVINMGVLGYGPDQSLIQMERDVLPLDPDLVILGIYPRNDFKDITRNQLFYFNLYDELVRSKNNIVEQIYPLTNTQFLFDYMGYKFNWFPTSFSKLFTTFFGDNNDYFLFFPDLRFNKARFKAMHRILEEFKYKLDQNEIKFLVLIFPSHESLENSTSLMKKGIHPERIFYGEDLVERMCKAANINYFNLYPIFKENKKEFSRYTVNKTFHFTPETTKEIAGYVKNPVDQLIK